MARAGGPVPCDVKDPSGVGDFGHDGDGDQEDQDRADPDGQVGEQGP